MRSHADRSWTETTAPAPDTASVSLSSMMSSSPADTEGVPKPVDHTAAVDDTEELIVPDDGQGEEGQGEDGQGESAKGSIYLDAVESPSVAEILQELRNIPDPPARPGSTPVEEEDQVTTQTEHQAAENQAALAREAGPPIASVPAVDVKEKDSSKRRRKRRMSRVDAVVNMREDSAGAFQVSRKSN